jgi:hypothetical protein
MNANELFNVYIAGLLVNLLAGFIGWYLIRKLYEWLPSSADLHEKFRVVALEKNATKKITELTPLLFISFYWLFLANLIWVIIQPVIEIMNWPNLLVDYSSDVEWLIGINAGIKKMMPGLVWGRSLLYLFLSVYTAICFFRGLRIAKQCWDVYKSIDLRRNS